MIFPPKLYFHNYGFGYESWALVISLTSMNAVVQLGPFWFSIAWKELF